MTRCCITNEMHSSSSSSSFSAPRSLERGVEQQQQTCPSAARNGSGATLIKDKIKFIIVLADEKLPAALNKSERRHRGTSEREKQANDGHLIRREGTKARAQQDTSLSSSLLMTIIIRLHKSQTSFSSSRAHSTPPISLGVLQYAYTRCYQLLNIALGVTRHQLRASEYKNRKAE